VIVIDPELEAWVWASSPHVSGVLGWHESGDALRAFLNERGLWDKASPKPLHPKEAMQQALREKNKPFGAPLFSELAKKVSFGGCEDPAFRKLWNQLKHWFPTRSVR